MNAIDAYERMAAHLRRCADLSAGLRLLEWDQETYMPPGAANSRARQIGALSAIVHEQQTNAEFLDLVDELATMTLDEGPAADVRETQWQLRRERALDTELVRERAEMRAQARSAWIVARADNDFAALAPHLDSLVAMERRIAQTIDASRDPYEVLLEGYEPGLSLTALESIFAAFGKGLQPLVERIESCRAGRPYPHSPLRGDFDPRLQHGFNREVVARIGFDFDCGRIDESAHPFSTSIGNDVRLTTRYDQHDLGYALYSSLHEAGHGLYEQGLDPQLLGLPRGSACSLGVHESQSRLWENLVGRSAAFCAYLLPHARAVFPSLESVALDALLLEANRIEPSLIRTEADELTYNLHILVRFDLERALISGNLAVADLPGAWKEQMQRRLGIAPLDDRQGVLQDVHWSAGEFGYFPTYTLGNIYAAQLFEAARRDLGDIDAAIHAGEFAPLLAWLRHAVHQHGQRYRAAELIERASGEAATPAALLRHLEAKVAWVEDALSRS